MQTAGGREPLAGDLGSFYDAIENPRAGRNELPILRGDELAPTWSEVRERALEVLDELDLEDAERPAPARRIRLRDADRARAPAQRDDAAAAADGRRLRAARARPGPARASPSRTGPRWSRSPPAAHEVGAPAAASPTTTSARVTGSSSRPS